MTTQTTIDLQARRADIARRIEATTDAIADVVTALGQAASGNADGDLTTDLSRQVLALNDHLRDLRGELVDVDRALTTRHTLATLREALHVAAMAIDELQGDDLAAPVAGDAEPRPATLQDLRHALGAWHLQGMRPTVYS